MADKIVFVNQAKLERAKDIVALLKGTRVVKTPDESELREKFISALSEEKIDIKSEDAIEFVYVKLGGLVRTQAEQAQADKVKKEMQAKARKRMVE